MSPVPRARRGYVAQGGRAELINGHQVVVAQDYALDVLQEVNGQTHTGDPKNAANYYAWGEPVRAPADGVIATVSCSAVQETGGRSTVSTPSSIRAD